jgi:hypothetical protein
MLTISKREFGVLFIVTFIVKFISCLFFLWLEKSQTPSVILSVFASSTGDTDSYFHPFYNLYFHHSYYVSNAISQKIYAGRMPYYGFLYFCLLPFFSLQVIYNSLAIFQILLESSAIILFSQIIYTYTNNKKIFYLTIVFMNLCLYITSYTARLAPESPGIAIMIFAWWFYEKYRQSGKLMPLFFAGLMINVLTGYKPYMGIMFFIIALDIFLSSKKNGLLIQVAKILLLSSTFIATTCAWTLRNYSLTHKIIPLMQVNAGIPYPPSLVALPHLISAWGASAEAWNPKADGSFFYSGNGAGRISTGSNVNVNELPVTTYYNQDSLLMLRNYISTISLTKVDRHADSAIAKRIDLFTDSYKKQYPIEFYLIAPLKLIKAFTVNSGSYYIFSIINGKTNIFVLVVKLFQSLLYYVFLIGGIIGCLFYFKKFYLYSWLLFYLLFFFCFVTKYVELRYFLYAYPSLLFGLMMVINRFIKKSL